jgi:hypothetical protein
MESRRETVQGDVIGRSSDVTVVLQWCYSGVTVVLQWCYSGVTVVLQWFYNGVTVLLQSCYSNGRRTWGGSNCTIQSTSGRSMPRAATSVPEVNKSCCVMRSQFLDLCDALPMCNAVPMLCPFCSVQVLCAAVASLRDAIIVLTNAVRGTYTIGHHWSGRQIGQNWQCASSSAACLRLRGK